MADLREQKAAASAPADAFSSAAPAYHLHATAETKHVVDLDSSSAFAADAYGYHDYSSSGFQSALHGTPAATFINFSQGEDQLYRSIHTGSEHGSLDDDGLRAVAMPQESDAFYFGGLHAALPSLSGSDGSVLKQHHYGTSGLDPKFGSDARHSYELPLVGVVGSVAAATGAAPAGVDAPCTPPGGYLEPGYHFFSTAAPRDIIDAVVHVLRRKEIDCVVKAEKFRISATSYGNGSQMLPFSVRVFATEGYAHRYAVEFQRRTGSVIAFNELYRSCRHELESLAEPSSAPRRAPMAPPSFDSLPPLSSLPPLPASASAADVAAAAAAAAEETENNTRSTLKSLVAMAGSKFTDVKSQAMSALCDMTHNCTPATTTLMLSERVVTTCSEELKSQVEDVHRCAVTAVANLAYRREDVGTAVMSADGLNSLIHLSASKTPQVQRECARALNSLATAVGSRMDNAELRAALRTMMCSDDLKAQYHSQELKKTLHITAI